MKHIKIMNHREGVDLFLFNENLWYTFLISGIVLGLVEGYKPGPLTTVVITQTLKHNWKSGLKVAMSPLLTDGPIILICALIYRNLSNFAVGNSLLSLAGGCFLLWLAYDSAFKSNLIIENKVNERDDSLKRGIITNLLNPNPWSYWALIGAPFLIEAWNVEFWMPILFIAGFFTCLIGAKISVALLAGYGSNYLQGKNYRFLMYICSIILTLFAAIFFMNAIDGLT